MTSKETLVGTLVAAKRLNLSRNGNPRFDVTVKLAGSPTDEHLVLTTSSDSACSYDVENLVRSREEVAIGLTRARRIETLTRLDVVAES